MITKRKELEKRGYKPLKRDRISVGGVSFFVEIFEIVLNNMECGLSFPQTCTASMTLEELFDLCDYVKAVYAKRDKESTYVLGMRIVSDKRPIKTVESDIVWREHYEKTALLEALKALIEISHRIKAIKHAGDTVSADDWAALYRITEQAFSVVKLTEGR